MNQPQPVLKLRCLLQHEEGLFVAHCIDFNLACQADTEAEAREKMHGMIVDYVERVMELVQEGDLASAKQLMNRRSPWDIRARYAIAAIAHRCRNGFELLGRTWREPVNSPITT